MNPETILNRITRALTALINAAEPYEGLFPSLLDRQTGAMLTDLPPAIEGQRNGDRAHLGSNLMHDEVTLKTCYALGQQDLTQAADQYLERFATHCTHTESGLFTWGEHAFWHLLDDRPGNSYIYNNPESPDRLIHDHLRAAPLWLWQKLHAINPDCIQHFAEGLDNHWVEIEPLEYIRHAHIDKKNQRFTPTQTSCDFPRHGGFYIFDWAFAYTQSKRQEFIEQIRQMLDYWWEKRQPNGLLNTESRTHEGHFAYRMLAVAQTLSLGVSLLEAADLLDSTHPDLTAEMRRRAHVYIEGFFAAPHDLDQAIFVSGFCKDAPQNDGNTMTIWGSYYGRTPASYTALLSLCAYRLTQDNRFLSWAEAVGRCYLTTPFPTQTTVPAMDAGMGLGLLADLHDLTDDPLWLNLERAGELAEIYFDQNDLPKGASNIDWYESQMGPGFLLHGLARLALLSLHGRASCPLNADYTGR